MEASTLSSDVAKEILAERVVTMTAFIRKVYAAGAISNDKVKAIAALEHRLQRALATLGIVAAGDESFDPLADEKKPKANGKAHHGSPDLL